mmetsp:Transcript_59794/g.160238  ORF Transcript_59794/g.160238 Transcript_59794/m.160238 type:complete len:233 (+) Transcript_59794:601-1299(+)
MSPSKPKLNIEGHNCQEVDPVHPLLGVCPGGPQRRVLAARSQTALLRGGRVHRQEPEDPVDREDDNPDRLYRVQGWMRQRLAVGNCQIVLACLRGLVELGHGLHDKGRSHEDDRGHDSGGRQPAQPARRGLLQHEEDRPSHGICFGKPRYMPERKCRGCRDCPGPNNILLLLDHFPRSLLPVNEVLLVDKFKVAAHHAEGERDEQHADVEASNANGLAQSRGGGVVPIANGR